MAALSIYDPFTKARWLDPLFLQRFGLMAAAFCLLWQASLVMTATMAERQMEAAVVEGTRRAEDDLSRRLASYGADLRILASGAALNRFAADSGARDDDVLRDFLNYAMEKHTISQVRFLDRDGREAVRVDRRGDEVRAIPRADLQDKSARYYFSHAIGLTPGEVYVSALDLNVEHGVIETPWRPMLRLATPIQPGGPETRGVVVLNVDASELLQRLEAARPVGAPEFQLLNDAGYWLTGRSREALWGFMFDHDATLAREAPGVWRRIAADAADAFEVNGITYIFRTLQVSRAIAQATMADRVQAADVAWKILAPLEAPSLFALWSVEHLPVGVGGLAILAVIALSWTGATVARRDSELQKRQAEDELARKERLVSLGSLVAGVAHELNTPIGNAVAIASTLDDSAKRFAVAAAAGQLRRSNLEAFVTEQGEGARLMLRGLERASELIGHFKQVAVDQTSEQRRTFRLDELARDVIASMRPQFKRAEVRLEARIQPGLSLDSYPGPLGQVLINLIANAMLHAYDDRDNGVVTVEARAVGESDVELVVRDDGKGMTPETLARMFEPFFTTRLGEGGSGLGLSIIYNIVTGCLGGAIRADGAPGAGAAVTVRLPRIAPAEAGAGRERGTYNVESHAA